MAEIAKINGVDIADIAAINGVAIGDIAKFGGLDIPAAGPPDPNVVVSGAGSSECDGEYVLTGTMNGRNYYELDATHFIFWNGVGWKISVVDPYYSNGDEDVAYPYLSAVWSEQDGASPPPTVTSA